MGQTLIWEGIELVAHHDDRLGARAITERWPTLAEGQMWPITGWDFARQVPLHDDPLVPATSSVCEDGERMQLCYGPLDAGFYTLNTPDTRHVTHNHLIRVTSDRERLATCTRAEVAGHFYERDDEGLALWRGQVASGAWQHAWHALWLMPEATREQVRDEFFVALEAATRELGAMELRGAPKQRAWARELRVQGYDRLRRAYDRLMRSERMTLDHPTCRAALLTTLYGLIHEESARALLALRRPIERGVLFDLIERYGVTANRRASRDVPSMTARDWEIIKYL